MITIPEFKEQYSRYIQYTMYYQKKDHQERIESLKFIIYTLLYNYKAIKNCIYVRQPEPTTIYPWARRDAYQSAGARHPYFSTFLNKIENKINENDFKFHEEINKLLETNLNIVRYRNKDFYDTSRENDLNHKLYLSLTTFVNILRDSDSRIFEPNVNGLNYLATTASGIKYNGLGMPQSKSQIDRAILQDLTIDTKYLNKIIENKDAIRSDVKSLCERDDLTVDEIFYILLYLTDELELDIILQYNDVFKINNNLHPIFSIVESRNMESIADQIYNDKFILSKFNFIIKGLVL